MSTNSFVQVNVGGMPFTISLSDIEKFPGSFFQCMVKKEWTNNSVDAINIQRDGALFKFVFAFIVAGSLPRDKDGLIDLDDATLEALTAEADFYGLETLSKECKVQRRKDSQLDLTSYLTIRKYISKLSTRGGSLPIDISSRLTRALKCIWSPFCVVGKISSYSYSHSHSNSKNTKFYGESSINSINVEELIAVATQSPFGRGTETVIDTAVRNSFEMDASLLDSAVLSTISQETDCASMAPHLDLTLRPYKLVIYQEGGHFNEHRDTVRGDGHIGTLVVILNSEYTGGELEVTHGGRTEVVTGPYNWVAMYGDCLHKINPVTSGTRVSLIYDIYGTVSSSDAVRTANEQEDEAEEDDYDEEEDDESEDFWEYQPAGCSAVDAIVNKCKEPRGADLARVFEALDEELKSLDSIIICLQHLYPECQTNPAFLKGGDRALYDILISGGSYEVQVVAATIYHTCYDGNRDENTTTCTLFSPAIVKKTLGLKIDSDEEEEDTETGKGPAEEKAARKKQKVNSTAAVGRTKLVLPNDLAQDSLLDYTPYIEHTGNESQAGKSVYIVAGLQVRRRV